MTHVRPGRSLETAEWRAWLAPGRELPEAEQQVIRLVEAAGAETLHWGRNYLYRMEIETGEGRLAVVVKQFRTHGWLARRRKRRGESKAARSWRAAGWLQDAGITTPQRVAWIESRQPDGPSLYVSRYLPDRLEARRLIREMNSEGAVRAVSTVPHETFLTALGRLARRLHDARILYRDFSVGNILVRPAAEGEALPDLALVDCNRARRLSRFRMFPLWRRMRDLSRLNLRRAEHRRDLLTAYFGGPPPIAGRLLQAYFQFSFEGKQVVKRRLRAPLRWRKKLAPRTAHAHIPAPDPRAAVRERIVWDALSDQPFQHATRLERLAVRVADAREHGVDAGLALRALPRAWRRYQELSRRPPDAPAWEGTGVAVRPWPADPEGLLAALADLGLRHVLLRLHPWQEDHAAEEVLARELALRGVDLTFALAQNRELVLDRKRWADAVETLATRFTPFGSRFQIGQAVNRSKWGVWNGREFVEMAAVAAEILHRHVGVELLGPGVIDFEPHALAALLNRRGCPRFDIVACLLYVDRRGAPENRQLGFDAAAKARLMRAIGETSRAGGSRLWITEVNWPLWEGPHSPAGRDVAVDEETQANYLVRFMVEVAAAGVVERAYWWQAVAKGYGLLDPTPQGLRLRPAYHALLRMQAELSGLRYRGRLPASPTTRAYELEGPGVRRIVAWSVAGSARCTLPRPAVAGRERDGQSLSVAGAREIELLSSPRYYDLEV